METFYSDFEQELENYRSIFRNYIVYPTGKVKDQRTGKHVKPGKLRTIRLVDDEGKAVIFSLPHLIATMFIENAHNAKRVKHLDSDFKNLSADNLLWFSATANSSPKSRQALVLRIGE